MQLLLNSIQTQADYGGSGRFHFNQKAQALSEIVSGGSSTDGDKDSVVASDGAGDGWPTGAVDRGRDWLSHRGLTFDHEQGIASGDDGVGEPPNRDPRRASERLNRSDVDAAMLTQSEITNVSRDAGLGDLVIQRVKRLDQVVLSSEVVLLNQLEERLEAQFAIGIHGTARGLRGL